MVKIKTKSLISILALLVVILLINNSLEAFAAGGNNLLISNVDVKVSSKTLRNLSSGETISEEARPDHIVEFRVAVRNNFTRALDIKIRDITVKTSIEGIDDGEDLEIESERFDLSADTERKSFFKFDIPLQVREDAYNVIITAEGQDEDGTSEKSQMKIKLEVVNDNHLLKIVKMSLTPEQVSCNRKNVQLSTTIMNIGDLDEDGVSVQLSNRDLGIDIKDKIGTIFSRPNEPESKFSKTYSINVPNDAESGNYLITLKALYNDDRKSTENTANLIVNNCAKPSISPIKPSEDDSGVQVIMPQTGKNNASVTQPSTDLIPEEGAIVTQEGFLSSNAFVAGIVITEIIAVIAGVFLIAYVFRRKSPAK